MSNHILIYGYGREGQSTERFIHQHYFPEIVTIYDVKTHPIKLTWDEYDQIWLSPGVPPEKIPEAHQHKITSQANYFFHNLSTTERKKVIAITGSKGKTSTTTTLTHTLSGLGLRVESAGNIGQPLLEMLPKLQRGELDYLVCEISSFQAEFIDKSPHTVIFLNLFPDHLDRHGNEESYFKAKENLWRHQIAGDHFIKALETSPLSSKLYPLSSILDADHFRQNLGIIPVVLDKLGIKYTPKKLATILQNSPIPDHRLQMVREVKSVKFYNDAIATNPTATTAAVRHFGKNLGVLILGGKSSQSDPTELIRTIEKLAPKTQLIVTKSEFSEELKQIKNKLNITEVPDLPAAIKHLTTNYQLLPPNSVVLLSPAAKSFDQYPGYPAKGDHFKELVNNL